MKIKKRIKISLTAVLIAVQIMFCVGAFTVYAEEEGETARPASVEDIYSSGIFEGLDMSGQSPPALPSGKSWTEVSTMKQFHQALVEEKPYIRLLNDIEGTDLNNRPASLESYSINHDVIIDFGNGASREGKDWTQYTSNQTDYFPTETQGHYLNVNFLYINSNTVFYNANSYHFFSIKGTAVYKGTSRLQWIVGNKQARTIIEGIVVALGLENAINFVGDLAHVSTMSAREESLMTLGSENKKSKITATSYLMAGGGGQIISENIDLNTTQIYIDKNSSVSLSGDVVFSTTVNKKTFPVLGGEYLKKSIFIAENAELYLENGSFTLEPNPNFSDFDLITLNSGTLSVGENADFRIFNYNDKPIISDVIPRIEYVEDGTIYTYEEYGMTFEEAEQYKDADPYFYEMLMEERIKYSPVEVIDRQGDFIVENGGKLTIESIGSIFASEKQTILIKDAKDFDIYSTGHELLPGNVLFDTKYPFTAWTHAAIGDYLKERIPDSIDDITAGLNGAFLKTGYKRLAQGPAFGLQYVDESYEIIILFTDLNDGHFNQQVYHAFFAAFNGEKIRLTDPRIGPAPRNYRFADDNDTEYTVTDNIIKVPLIRTMEEPEETPPANEFNSKDIEANPGSKDAEINSGLKDTEKAETIPTTPDTGDENPILVYILLASMAAALLGFAVMYMLKRKISMD